MHLADIISVDPFGHRPHPGAGEGFVVLLAFLASYLAIRTSARLTRSVSWWPGGVQSGGVHLHHLVWGICLMLLCGFLGFAAPLEAPWWHVVAIGFGVGAGFTMDEFALWVHLQDVYWSEEGRLSFDAVVSTVAFAALVVLGTRPFGLDDPGSVTGTAAAVVLMGGLACVAFAKGRVVIGMVGVFVPLVALVGATRLARPSSPWATWRCGEAKRRRAHSRFGADRPLSRAWRRANDLLAGAPSDERSLVAPLDQRGRGDEDDAPGHEREQAEHPGAQGERMFEGQEQPHADDAEEQPQDAAAHARHRLSRGS